MVVMGCISKCDKTDNLPCSWNISVRKLESSACEMSVWMYTSKLSWYLDVSFMDLSISSLPRQQHQTPNVT
jgi:hypothetical protein